MARSDSHEPNEYGFAGAGTAPQVSTDDREAPDPAEEVAVPADDLTGALSDTVASGTSGDDGEDDRARDRRAHE